MKIVLPKNQRRSLTQEQYSFKNKTSICAVIEGASFNFVEKKVDAYTKEEEK